ncbi:MAG: alpha/beta fold hydrolase [Candidatus Fimenecus sp.]
MLKKKFSFKSSSDLCNINGVCIAPDNISDVKAVIQITHGMAEHKERYFGFMEKLCDAGFASYIIDLLGHGESVESSNDLGYFGNRMEQNLLDDMKTLNDLIHSEYPETPIFMFGHSMGSFLTRAYTSIYESSVKAAVYCGTSGANPIVPIAIKLAEIQIKKNGEKSKGDFLNKIAFASYNKKTDKRTPFDWLSVNTENVDEYISDKLCGFTFTNNGFLTLFRLVKYIQSPEWYEKVPNDMPLYLIAGSDDPVGSYGKGVKSVYRKLLESGHKVKFKLWTGDRHEILLENNADEVISDVIDWYKKTLITIK